MIPESIGRYEVQCLLGEGAFGQVFAARDPALDRSVAIKLLRSMYGNDASFMARFRTEAASLARLQHANITAIYDILQDESQHGMVMELVHGHTLEHVLKQMRRLPLREALAVAVQTASGLGYIHRLGIVHRDIKPSNIMLTTDGVLKIMDFGIARIQGSTRLTHDGSAVGTLAYAAPEQIKRDEGTPASDQYSLACMIYEMLSGDPPFDAVTEFELMQAQIAKAPAPVSTKVQGIPPEVDQALLRALAKTPAERFGSVAQFVAVLGGQAVQAEAGDILRALMGRADALPPIPERAPARAGGSSKPKSSKPSKPSQPVVAQLAGVRANTPIIVMGIAVGIAVAVGAFIMLDQSPLKSAAPPQVAQAQPDTVVAALPTPPTAAPPPAVAPAKPAEGAVLPAPPAQQPAPSAVQPPPPAPQTDSGLAAAPVTPPLSSQLTPPPQSPPTRVQEMPPPRPSRPVDDYAQKPNLEFAPAIGPAAGNEPTVERLESYAATTGEPTGSKPAQKPVQRMPKEQPTYQGKVEDWIAGNLLFVQSPTGGVKKVDLSLYGIVGKDGNAKEAADVRKALEAYAKGRVIKCWLRAEDNKQKNLCFLDGTDIALWALEQKLVKPSKHAPPEYLAVKQ